MLTINNNWFSTNERLEQKSDAYFKERMTEEMWLKFQPLFEENKRLCDELAACTPNRHVEEIASLEQELAQLNGAIAEEDRLMAEEQQKTAAAVSTLIAEKTAGVLGAARAEEATANALIAKEEQAAKIEQAKTIEAARRQLQAEVDQEILRETQKTDAETQKLLAIPKAQAQEVAYALKRVITRVRTEISVNRFDMKQSYAEHWRNDIEHRLQEGLKALEEGII